MQLELRLGLLTLMIKKDVSCMQYQVGDTLEVLIGVFAKSFRLIYLL